MGTTNAKSHSTPTLLPCAPTCDAEQLAHKDKVGAPKPKCDGDRGDDDCQAKAKRPVAWAEHEVVVIEDKWQTSGGFWQA